MAQLSVWIKAVCFMVVLAQIADACMIACDMGCAPGAARIEVNGSDVDVDYFEAGSTITMGCAAQVNCFMEGNCLFGSRCIGYWQYQDFDGNWKTFATNSLYISSDAAGSKTPWGSGNTFFYHTLTSEGNLTGSAGRNVRCHLPFLSQAYSPVININTTDRLPPNVSVSPANNTIYNPGAVPLDVNFSCDVDDWGYLDPGGYIGLVVWDAFDDENIIFVDYADYPNYTHAWKANWTVPLGVGTYNYTCLVSDEAQNTANTRDSILEIIAITEIVVTRAVETIRAVRAWIPPQDVRLMLMEDTEENESIVFKIILVTFGLFICGFILLALMSRGGGYGKIPNKNQFPHHGRAR